MEPYDVLEIYPYLYIGIYNGVEEIIYFHTSVIYSLLSHYLFLGAFQNTGAAQTAEFLFLLCQLVVLITALQETKSIVTQTMEHMLEFLKLAIPSYMICIAAAGSGLSASVFYKLLLGFICLIEGIVVAGCVPAVEAYMLIGVAESLMGGRQISGNHGNDQERDSLGFERLNRTGKWQRHTASNNNTSY